MRSFTNLGSNTMVSVGGNRLFLLLSTRCNNDPTLLIITLTGARTIIKVSGHHHQCLAGGYDLEIGHF